MAFFHSLSAGARRASRACCHAALGTFRGSCFVGRHAFGILFKTLIVAYFLFCALLLTLRYGLLPNIQTYKPQIEQVASDVLGRHVLIGGLTASWRGLRPHLTLRHVIIHDRDGKPALILPKVAATVAWSSALVADLRLQRLELTEPDMDIRRDADGKLYVAGIFVDLDKPGEGKGLDWVLEQEEIVIRSGRISWDDSTRAAPQLVLQDLDLVLRNRWNRHRLALKATPPADYAQPIDVRADFFHPPFAKRISDVRRWTGELYAALQDTDLAVWKAYVDYPVDVTQGTGSLRAWLAFDHAKVADFTADLHLADVLVRLRSDLQPLDLVSVNGRISMREEIDLARDDAIPTFGTQGHAISLTDFGFVTRDGLVFPATTLSERYVPARAGAAEKFEVRANLLDLHTLADFAERLPLDASQRAMLADFAPRGLLKDFSAQWQGSYPNFSAYHIKGQFAGLSMKAQPARAARAAAKGQAAQAAVPAIPGFANLSGSVDASEHGGRFALESNQLVLNLPGYFGEPELPFEKLDMRADWTFQKNDRLLFNVERMEFVQDGIAGSLAGRHLMSLNAKAGKPLGHIDVTGRIADIEFNRIGRYLPLQMPEHTRKWLQGALEAGRAQQVAVRVKGDLEDFPFESDRPGGKPSGEFTVAGKIVDGRLNYDPEHFGKDGKSPLWPKAEHIQGTIRFDRTRMEIRGQTAVTQGVALSNVQATIPDLLSDDPQLQIVGHASGPLQEFIRYANASPVQDWISNFTDETKGSGNARLDLKLQLPLNRMLDAKVQGALHFDGNEVVLAKGTPPLANTAGKLEFTERGVTMQGIRANFVGGPVLVTAGTQRDGTIVVKAAGSLTADGVRRAFPTPAVQRVVQRIAGSTRYAASVTIKKDSRPEILVESPLQGMALDFPAPLNKAAADSMPFRLAIDAGAASGNLVRDRIAVSLGTAIAAQYEREKNMADAYPAWKVQRGGIGINVPAPQPDSGLIANVNLRSLNIDAWSRVVSALATTAKAGAAVPDGLNITQYIEPEVLAARTTELIVAGKKLDNVVVGASHQKGAWQANIDSEQASGYVTWDESPNGQGLGKVTARLASLIIPKSAASDVSDLLEGNKSTSQIPALDIIAENFELFGKRFGHLELLANNAGSGNGREWQINKLTITNPDGELKATGKWNVQGNESKSTLNYVLDIDDAGRMLDRFGFQNVLRGGRGKMSGELQWKGLPFSLDIPTLSGQLSLDIAAGQFLKVDPSAAKLLGVLSLQSLPRRLALDFRDVFSEGFAFDGVVGNATISRGVAKTDNFKMRSLTATIAMDGSADINRETANLHVVIVPEINAGAASLVYGLAVNPMVGVGTFLAQLFLREPLMRAFTYEYQVTGPWKDPAITKLNRKNDGPQQQGALPKYPERSIAYEYAS